MSSLLSMSATGQSSDIHSSSNLQLIIIRSASGLALILQEPVLQAAASAADYCFSARAALIPACSGRLLTMFPAPWQTASAAAESVRHRAKSFAQVHQRWVERSSNNITFTAQLFIGLQATRMTLIPARFNLLYT